MAAALTLLGAATAGAAGRCGDHPWCDTSKSADERANLLLGALTQDEKISLLGGDDVLGVIGGDHRHIGVSNGVDRVAMPTQYFSDGPVGPRQGKTTAMPIPMALAATFDPALARLHGATVAVEARDKGNDVVYAPTVNVMRTPLNGRTFEAYGEDPWLVTRLTVGWIEGAQGQGVIADVKHFAANNQEGQDLTGRLGSPGMPLGAGQLGNRAVQDSRVDERTLREVYLPQFEAAVREANVGTVMCSYNKLNGQYACENSRLLQDILRKEWGFKGFTVADYGAAHDTVASLQNGLDFEPWPPVAYRPELVTAVMASTLVPPSLVDEHVHAILRTLFAYGFFDRAAYKDDDAQIDKAGDAAAAQRIEESAITLLRNDKGTLPLDPSKLRSIAVIGKQATTFVTGGGSGNVKPFAYRAPLDAIKERAGSRVAVEYADGSDAAAATAAAKKADVAVVFAGDYQTEGADRACLSIDCPEQGYDQEALIDGIAEANPRTVVVLMTGGPALTPFRDRVAALLEAWYPGQEGGQAVTRVLFGDADPGGRLPATFPASEDQLPTAGDPEKYPGVANVVTYKEGVLVGYRWFDAHGYNPAFPFGFGLSYTRFAMDRLKLARDGRVSVHVRNVGRRKGFAVPQLYLSLPSPGAGVVQPPRVLRGARKLELRPGQGRRVSFTLDRRALSYWDTASEGWRVARGCYGVAVGSSSRDLPLRGRYAVGRSCRKAATLALGKLR